MTAQRPQSRLSLGVSVGLLALTAAAPGAARSRTASAPVAVTGYDWVRFAPREKEAYISGFIDGAGAEQVRALAGRPGTDGGPPGSRGQSALRAAGTLHYRFTSAVYVSQLDDFYWWEDHVPMPVVDALIGINNAMLSQQPGTAP